MVNNSSVIYNKEKQRNFQRSLYFCLGAILFRSGIVQFIQLSYFMVMVYRSSKAKILLRGQ